MRMTRAHVRTYVRGAPIVWRSKALGTLAGIRRAERHPRPVGAIVGTYPDSVSAARESATWEGTPTLPLPPYVCSLVEIATV
jgi:hypothetical protein